MYQRRFAFDPHAACKGFFGRIKNEMFFGRSWTAAPVARFADGLNSYLRRYNQERIKMSLEAQSLKPTDKESIGLIA